MKQLKIGIDVHGVIDRLPQVFATLSQLLVASGHEVHILTGPSQTPEFEQQLTELGIKWTHFLSIVDYQLARGTMVYYDAKGHPWMDLDIWNRTKAEYCRDQQIDLHIDDTEIYGKYFSTPFALLTK